MCKYINKCRVTTSNKSISVLRENMNVQWWAERESVNVFSSPTFALFLLWQKTTESQLWLRPNFTGPTTFPFLILSVSVQMSTLLWISSPSEIQDTLPFLTWILSYGHINGNSWPPQGAVSSAVSRAEKMRSAVMTHAAGLAPWAADSGGPSPWGDTMCTASVWDRGAALWSWDNSSEWPSGSGPAWAHIYDYICFTFQPNHLVSLSCFHSQTLLRATGYKTQEWRDGYTLPSLQRPCRLMEEERRPDNMCCGKLNDEG